MAIVAALSLLIALGTGGSAIAAGVSVTVPCTGTGGGSAGLVAAIVNADANGGGTITLGSACSYSFTAAYTNSGTPDDLADWYGPAALPAIAAPITIVGNGSTIARSTASGTPDFRLFFVGANPSVSATPSWTTPGAGALVLENLTLSGGLAQGGNGGAAGGGGGLGAGGAIYNQGATVLTAVTLSGNSAHGGSVATSGTATGGGGVGADAASTTGGGFGSGFAEPATYPTGGLGVLLGGGGGAGFGSSEDGVGVAGAGAGGGSLTGTAGDGASGGAKGGDGGGGGASAPALGGGGGKYGEGGAGAGGGGVGSGGGGAGGGGGFGGGGGYPGGEGGFGAGGAGSGGGPGFAGGTGAASTAVGGGGAGLGGAIFNQQGTLVAEDATLSGNTAAGGAAGGSGATAGAGGGGAIFSLNGVVGLINDTIASNTADDGGALYLVGYDASSKSTAGVGALVNNILSGSLTGTMAGTHDLVVNKPGTVADGTANQATAAAVVPSQNIVDSTSGTLSGTPSTANPALGALANNGGPGMFTMLPGAGSPALGAGSTSGAPTTDERGTARPAGGPIDLGAVQVSVAGTAPAAPTPVVVTGPAKSVTSSTATVTAAIDPEGLAGSYYFAYGTSTNYGSKTSTATVPAGSTAVALSAGLSRLKPNTSYHYRIVAANANGTSDGLDSTFKTSRQSPAGLSVTTKPLHALAFPYRFMFSGRLRLPRGITNGAACGGKISVRIKRGRKTVSFGRSSLFVGCTWKRSVRLSNRKAVPGKGRLSVTVSFGGNTVLAPRTNKPFTIRYG